MANFFFSSLTPGLKIIKIYKITAKLTKRNRKIHLKPAGSTYVD